MNGLKVEALVNHFPSTAPDTEWLPFVGERGWIAITQDQLRSAPEEQEALLLHGVKTFVLIGTASHGELAEIFLANIKKIIRLIEEHEEAFLAKIHIKSGRLEVVTASMLLARLTRQRRRRPPRSPK